MEMKQWWIDAENSIVLSSPPRGTINSSRYVRVVEAATYDALILRNLEMGITLERLQWELARIHQTLRMK